MSNETPEGPAVPGGVDANLGPFDEGLTDDPAYRGKTYGAAMLIGGLLLVALIILVIVVALAN